jgi:hypothetical protein
MRGNRDTKLAGLPITILGRPVFLCHHEEKLKDSKILGTGEATSICRLGIKKTIDFQMS